MAHNKNKVPRCGRQKHLERKSETYCGGRATPVFKHIGLSLASHFQTHVCHFFARLGEKMTHNQR